MKAARPYQSLACLTIRSGISFSLEDIIIETIPLRHLQRQSQNVKKAWHMGSSESLNK